MKRKIIYFCPDERLSEEHRKIVLHVPWDFRSGHISPPAIMIYKDGLMFTYHYKDMK